MKNYLRNALLPVLCGVAVAGMSSCGTKDREDEIVANPDYANVKIGLICLHDTNSTYDKNFIDSMYYARKELGITKDQLILKTGIEENEACTQAAVEMAEKGCNFIFADSFGHESYLIEAAKQFPNVQFSHATGTRAHDTDVNLSNYHNAFASIYEGRYLAGVAAGKKLEAMIAADPSTNHKVGYVGAFTYAEVISGYTSWYLGVKSIVSDVTMDVTFTGSWYDETAEKNGANKLISNGCELISQHADSMGAPTACEEKGVPNVTYNGSTKADCPDTFVTYSRIDWAPYFKLCINAVKDGTEIPTDYTGTIATGSVVTCTEYGDCCPEGTAAAVEAAKQALANGTLKVFDCSKFTVHTRPYVDQNDTGLNANATIDELGHVTAYNADVDLGDYQGDRNVIKTVGDITYFDESGADFRSAPYFDLQIDGITLLDVKF